MIGGGELAQHVADRGGALSRFDVVPVRGGESFQAADQTPRDEDQNEGDDQDGGDPATGLDPVDLLEPLHHFGFVTGHRASRILGCAELSHCRARMHAATSYRAPSAQSERRIPDRAP